MAESVCHYQAEESGLVRPLCVAWSDRRVLGKWVARERERAVAARERWGGSSGQNESSMSINDSRLQTSIEQWIIQRVKVVAAG